MADAPPPPALAEAPALPEHVRNFFGGLAEGNPWANLLNGVRNAQPIGRNVDNAQQERTRQTVASSIRTHGLFEIAYRTAEQEGAEELGEHQYSQIIGEAAVSAVPAALAEFGTIEIFELRNLFDYDGFNVRALIARISSFEEDAATRRRDMQMIVAAYLTRGTSLSKIIGKSTVEAQKVLTGLIVKYDIRDHLQGQIGTRESVSFSRIAAAFPHYATGLLASGAVAPRIPITGLRVGYHHSSAPALIHEEAQLRLWESWAWENDLEINSGKKNVQINVPARWGNICKFRDVAITSSLFSTIALKQGIGAGDPVAGGRAPTRPFDAAAGPGELDPAFVAQLRAALRLGD